jgi:GNAT superfamily N-acetyltransferase
MTVHDSSGPRSPRIDAVDSAELAASARAVLIRAFAADPITRWMFPQDPDVLAGFARLVDGFSSAAFAHGTARITTDRFGVAVWLPPGLSVDHEAVGSVVAHDVPASVRAEAAELIEQLGRYQPREPHWYLPLIGVDPGHHGGRRATALLAEGLARCDADHAVAYLESTNPRNVPLYERHGFEALDTVQVGSSPVMTPMRRRAR